MLEKFVKMMWVIKKSAYIIYQWSLRRVQLMVTCTTAMVECLVDANKTEQHQATINTGNGNIGVKVLTSVSRVNISFAKTSPVEDPDHIANPETDMTKHVKTNAAARSLQSKSFKNITMNNTIGTIHILRKHFYSTKLKLTT